VTTAIVRACSRIRSTASSHLVRNGSVRPRSGTAGQLALAEVEPPGDGRYQAGLPGFSSTARGPPSCAPGRWWPGSGSGRCTRGRCRCPDVGAVAVDFGVIDGRDVVTVPEAAGAFSTRQASLRVTESVRQARTRRTSPSPSSRRAARWPGWTGDGVLLDVQRQGGDPLGESRCPGRVKAQAKDWSKACQIDQSNVASVIGASPCGAGWAAITHQDPLVDAPLNRLRACSRSVVFPGNYCLGK